MNGHIGFRPLITPYPSWGKRSCPFSSATSRY